MIFGFQLGRGRAGPKQFLEDFEGLLQTGGYIGYEKAGGPKMVHAACWAHVRRALFEAHEVARGETAATGIVELIDDLFAIGQHARERDYGRVERQAWRLEHAPALLKKIKEQIEAAPLEALPASKLGKATAYALRLWPRLIRFLDYPELELTCRRLSVPVREYLVAILPGLADISVRKLPQLTPAAWAASHR